jgi:hypothetical protein
LAGYCDHSCHLPSSRLLLQIVRTSLDTDSPPLVSGETTSLRTIILYRKLQATTERKERDLDLDLPFVEEDQISELLWTWPKLYWSSKVTKNLKMKFLTLQHVSAHYTFKKQLTHKIQDLRLLKKKDNQTLWGSLWWAVPT